MWWSPTRMLHGFRVSLLLEGSNYRFFPHWPKDIQVGVAVWIQSPSERRRTKQRKEWKSSKFLSVFPFFLSPHQIVILRLLQQSIIFQIPLNFEFLLWYEPGFSLYSIGVMECHSPLKNWELATISDFFLPLHSSFVSIDMFQLSSWKYRFLLTIRTSRTF